MSFKHEYRPAEGESTESMERRCLATLDAMDGLPEPRSISYVLVEQVDHDDGTASFTLKMDYTPAT